MLSQGTAPLAPFIQAEFALSRAQVGLLNLALATGSYLTVAVSGRLIDRVGERRMLLASGLIGGFFAVVMIWSRSFAATLVLVALMSVGVAISTPAGSKGVMGWFDVRRRGTAMGIRQVGIPLGGTISSLILPSLALLAGWRGAFAVAGVLAVAGGLLCVVLYRDPPLAEGIEPGMPRLVSIRSVMRNRDLWRISIYSLVMIAAQFTFTLYVVIFAVERLGLPEVAAGALLAVGQAVAVGSRIGWGVLSDVAFGGRRPPVMAAVAAITVVSAVGFSFLGFGAPLWLVVLGVVGFGAGAIGWQGLYVTAVSELAGQAAAGTALGLSLAFSQLGALAAPPLFGLVVDFTGSYQLAWLGLGVLVLLGTLPIYGVKSHARG